jgi:hypothetical protein
MLKQKTPDAPHDFNFKNVYAICDFFSTLTKIVSQLINIRRSASVPSEADSNRQ